MDHVLMQICKIAEKYNADKVILFGSRARGDNSPVSDYDIAVIGEKMSDLEKANFCLDVEEVETLKKIDVAFITEDIKDDFTGNIMKEGVVVYEKTRDKINEF
ncbi:MAG TPA: nucleotidyltransferase domain-containing protein [Clostridiales bacterium]|nr:nucleotidyltransferase domain-containing protein [Clostridiales bacterium]